MRIKTKEYASEEWREFYKTLVFVFNLEKTLYDEHQEDSETDTTPRGSPANGVPRAYSSFSSEN
jgi:hypothetical protein